MIFEELIQKIAEEIAEEIALNNFKPEIIEWEEIYRFYPTYVWREIKKKTARELNEQYSKEETEPDETLERQADYYAAIRLEN